MAYSGTQTFNLSIEEIIEEAFERCQLETRTGYDLKTARRSMNLMLAEWANRGLNLWSITYATQTLTAGTNFYAIDQNVIDIVDAVVTTTAGATSNLEGDSNTTDVAVNRISRTEFINLSKKENSSSGDARPTQFALVPGTVTTGGSSSSGRPANDMTLFLYPSPDKAYIFKYFYLARIEDAGSYTNEADVVNRFVPCMCAGLAYYMAQKKAPQRVQEMKLLYEDELARALQEDGSPASVYISPKTYYPEI